MVISVKVPRITGENAEQEGGFCTNGNIVDSNTVEYQIMVPIIPTEQPNPSVHESIWSVLQKTEENLPTDKMFDENVTQKEGICLSDCKKIFL